VKLWGRVVDELNRRMSTKRCNVPTAITDLRAAVGVAGLAMQLATEEGPGLINSRVNGRQRGRGGPPPQVAKNTPAASTQDKKRKPDAAVGEHTKGYCFNFNSDGCTRRKCRFKHECEVCGATDHGKASCSEDP
jgi:hypothetical protein